MVTGKIGGIGQFLPLISKSILRNMENSYFENSFKRTFVGYDDASVSSCSYALSKSVNNLKTHQSDAKNITDDKTKKTVKDRFRRLRNFFSFNRRRRSTQRRTLEKAGIPPIVTTNASCSMSSMTTECNGVPIKMKCKICSSITLQ